MQCFTKQKFLQKDPFGSMVGAEAKEHLSQKCIIHTQNPSFYYHQKTKNNEKEHMLKELNEKRKKI